ncbi:MAG: enoyl-CoA hydratase-related protein [Planctomycetota bacterium]
MKSAYQNLALEPRPDGVLHVKLDRPRVHNAFNDELIEELSTAFGEATVDPAVRAILLTGNGPSFSAGADIDWMRRQGELDLDENVESGKRMARMFWTIYACRKPVVAGIHGAALGGGTGLAAVADVALASEDAFFGFTEVRLGIVPAVISPFVIEKLGSARARALFLLGERFDAREAERLGLVFRSCPTGELEATLERHLGSLLQGGPEALIAAKNLAQSRSGIQGKLDTVAELIARTRRGAEAREGLRAFLEKRRPAWVDGASPSARDGGR